MANQNHALKALGVSDELLDRIRSNQLKLGPFTFTLEEETHGPGDGVLSATLEHHKFERRFVFESKVSWTRQSRIDAIARLRSECGRKLLPMLIAPHLSERVLYDLLEENISAIDLCGNGLLIDLPKLFVLRTGAKKPKPLIQPTRISIYDSSNVTTLVPRVFLAQPTFPTTTAVLDACHARIMQLGDDTLPLTLSTVSKALRELDGELVTDRRGRERLLRDPERLLELLKRGFRLPSGSPLTFKTRLKSDEIWARLSAHRPTLRFVTTGRGSAPHYTGLASPSRLQLYVSDPQAIALILEAKPTQAFPNLELTQTADEASYFDARERDGVLWSSPLQCYLELARPGADPRERDVAEALRLKLLDDAKCSD